jgi:O-antigen ligase
MNFEKLNGQINNYLTIGLAFFIPLYPLLLPLLIGLLVINWLLLYKKIIPGIKFAFKNSALSFMILLFVFYLFGISYSNNFESGLKAIETKLSILILPLIYSSYYQITLNNINRYLKSFIFGCIVYAIVCLGWATYSYFKPVYTDCYGVLLNLGSNYFYYTNLSRIFHPSYMAMYLIFSLTSIWFFLFKRLITLNYLLILIILLLITFVLLLSSKSGWISLSIWVVNFTIWMFSTKRFFLSLLIFLSIIGAFLTFNLYFTPTFSNRIPNLSVIKNAIKGKDEQNNKITTSDDGSARRVFVWKASVDVIKQNLLWGVGTGDTRDELLDMYLKKGMKAEYNTALNSHNQYLNTGVTLGILGVFVLLLCLGIPFFIALKQNSYLLVGFISLISINFLFESMLETQAGVIFYAFFNTLLCLKLKNDSIETENIKTP